MDKELRLIKKRYGETMMKLCRELFPSVLETEGLLLSILEEKFAHDRNLADEIIKRGKSKVMEFRNYISSFLPASYVPSEVKNDSGKSAKELFLEAGFVLFPECKTQEDINKFRHLYAKGEKLCSFNGGRLEDTRVWFAVKTNYKDIKREDFPCPKREDEYGTSVISIQFLLTEKPTLSIKNRYNHAVTNPDNTFNSNLDNIAPGLMYAFLRDYNLAGEFEPSYSFSLPFYTEAGGKLYHYNQKINNIYYCDNNVIIENNEVVRLPDSVILADYFIFDKKNNEVFLYDPTLKDSFVSSFKDIKNIDFCDGIIKVLTKDNETICVELNSHRGIKSLYNPSVKEVGDSFLRYAKHIESICMPALKSCGHDFIRLSREVREVELPSLEEVGDAFLLSSEKLEKISLPRLKVAKHHFISQGVKVKEIFFPSLEACGYDFLFASREVGDVKLGSLSMCGSNFMHSVRSASDVSIPNLSYAPYGFMSRCIEAKNISMERLEETSDGFFEALEKVDSLYLPNLENLEKACLENLKTFKFRCVGTTKEGGEMV